MDTGKEREVMNDKRSGFEIIISSEYAQMDRHKSGHSLGLKEGSVRQIMVDLDIRILSRLKFFLILGPR
jgi:hypothetical protein